VALHFNVSKAFPYSDKKFRQAVALRWRWSDTADQDSLRTRLASTVTSQSFSRIRGYASPAFD